MDNKSFRINKVLVKKGESGARIDSFLSNALSVSRSRIKKLCEEGMVTIENSYMKAKYIVKEGDAVTVKVPPPLSSLTVTPEDIPLDVVFEDKHIIVVNKPSGMLVHPSGNNRKNTLVGALLYHCRDLSGIGGVERPGIVHRLDKDTSGLIVCAKNDLSHRSLSNQFKDRKVKKIYKALVAGYVKEDSALIDKALGRDIRDRKRISVNTVRGKKAVTYFEVVKRFKLCTLLKVRIYTGRTHQIRVHLASCLHPVMGDKIYGGKAVKKAGVSCSRLMLHSESIGFVHPITGNDMEFLAPIPKDMKCVLTKRH